MTIRENLKNTKKRIKRTLAFALTAIAGVAISWFYLSANADLNTWYALPIMALFTGLVTALIPRWGNRFTPVYAVTSTGLATLTIHIVTNFASSDDFWVLIYKFVVIVLIGLLTDLILSKNKPSLADLLLDTLICCIAVLSIQYLPTVMTIPIIIVAYILVLAIQVKPELSK